MRAPNGLELSCPAARASAHSLSRMLAGQASSNFPHASRVSCSELLGGQQDLRITRGDGVDTSCPSTSCCRVARGRSHPTMLSQGLLNTYVVVSTRASPLTVPFEETTISMGADAVITTSQ